MPEPEKREYLAMRLIIAVRKPLSISRLDGGEHQVSHKRVFALLTPEIRSYEMAQMLQKPVFVLPGCQRMSVNTLLCDTLGLAEIVLYPIALPLSCIAPYRAITQKLPYRKHMLGT